MTTTRMTFNRYDVIQLLGKGGGIKVDRLHDQDAFRVQLTFSVPCSMYQDELSVYGQALRIAQLFQTKPNEDNT